MSMTPQEIKEFQDQRILNWEEQQEKIKQFKIREKSIKQLDIMGMPIEETTEGTTGAETEEIEYNRDNINFPINTSNNVIQNTNTNEFKTYVILTMNSCNGRKKGMVGQNYIYDDKIEEIAKNYGISVRNVKNHIKKLSHADINLLKVVDTGHGLAYQINFATDGKYYTTINHKVLNELITSTNKDLLKLYVLLSYRCNTTTFTTMDRHHILECLGYCSTSGSYLTKLSTWTKTLAKLGLIEIQTTIKKGLGANGSATTKTYNAYKLTTLDYYNKLDAVAEGQILIEE